MGPRINIGVGDLAVSGEVGTELVTHSLGSCVGVIIHDPVARVGGLLHLMLPESSLNPDRARRQPGVFADSGLPVLFKTAYSLGAQKGRLRTIVVGGSQVLDQGGHFNIGKRNYAAVRRLLYRNNVLVAAEDVGGTVNRTVGLIVGTGEVWIKTNGAGMRNL
ncbi:MAG: chemotaxis protein CheD [Deltaproteobacteria bacterium]|nr:chemotaxis protein CheD [Deltaproteobacteria bacterium]